MLAAWCNAISAIRLLRPLKLHTSLRLLGYTCACVFIVISYWCFEMLWLFCWGSLMVVTRSSGVKGVRYIFPCSRAYMQGYGMHSLACVSCITNAVLRSKQRRRG